MGHRDSGPKLSYTARLEINVGVQVRSLGECSDPEIRVQIENGANGFLVDTPEECACRIVDLLNDPALRVRLGKAAREEVRRRFLMPALALDYLNMVKDHVLRPQVSVNGHGPKNRSKKYVEA